MKKYLTRRNVVLVIIAILAVGIVWFRNRSASSIVTPEVATVTRKDLVQSVIVSGQVQTERAATLNFPSPGKLAYVNVREGDRVTRGQALAGLNTGDLKAAEVAAYYKYLAADANAKQVEDAVKGHDTDETFGQKNERVAAQTVRDAAYDAWLTAKRAVSNSQLFSPVNGVVTEVTVSIPGDTVGVTDGVSVVDPSSLYFDAEIDETDASRVRVGDEVKIALDAYPDREFAGTVSQVGFATRVSDSGATVIPVRLSLPSADLGMLKIGLNGDAEIIYGRIEDTLVLPVDAVIDDQVTLEGGEKRTIETGAVTVDEIEIKSGLQDTDRVWIQL